MNRLSGILALIIWALFFVLLFFYSSQITFGIKNIYLDFFPCASPIKYSLGKIDSRFGLAREDFKDAIVEAEAIWERDVNRDLFTVIDSGELEINLIYDYRQDATRKLASLGLVIKDDKATYDKFKVAYESLLSKVQADRVQLEDQVAVFKKKKAVYEKNMNYWNSNNRISSDEVAWLNALRAELEKDSQNINSFQAMVNSSIDNLNALAEVLNRLAGNLNLSVSRYNTVGVNRGEEFEEGEFISDANREMINIYEYENDTKLIRVLAHELGHALGIGHVEGKDSIMYKYNQAVNPSLSTEDLSALKNRCRI